jgi:hypothetical protein
MMARSLSVGYLTRHPKMGERGQMENEDLSLRMTESTLSRNITAAGDESKYDAACKRLLSNKTILAWIMKNCLTEYQELSIEDIIQNCFLNEPKVGKYTVHQDEEPFRKNS